MTGHVQIEIRDHRAGLTVEFLRRVSAEAQDEWEGDGIVARIRAQTPSATADFMDRVRFYDLVRFRESLEREDGIPAWRAWLWDAHEYLTGVGERDAHGGLRLAVCLPVGNNGHLKFEMQMGKASLPDLRAQVDRVLARFPERVTWPTRTPIRYGLAQGPGAEGATADLMERLRERAYDIDLRISGGHRWGDGNGNVFTFTTRPPATTEQVAAAEARLGFRLPALLRRVYTEVGNGGFGPGFGMLSLPTSPAPSEKEEGDFDPDDELDAVLMYELSLRHHADPPWPAGLLTICYWGCGIESAVDCSKPEAPVICLDPNWSREEAEPRLPEDCRTNLSSIFELGCWVEAHSFESWLQAWLDNERAFQPASDPLPDQKYMSVSEADASQQFRDEDENTPDPENSLLKSDEDMAWMQSYIAG